MQRASTAADAALMSSGNSRNTYRTLPVSIYFERSIGNTFCSNAAQCGQLIEANSKIVTGALGSPSAISGSAVGWVSRAAAMLCAIAAPISCGRGYRCEGGEPGNGEGCREGDSECGSPACSEIDVAVRSNRTVR